MRKILLGLLSLLLVFSCTKDNNSPTPEENGNEITLTLNIQNGIISSKAIMGGSVPVNSITTLLPGAKLYFFDQLGKLTYEYTLTQSDIDAYTSGNGALVIQKIPDISTQIGMIANIPSDITLTVSDITSFQALTIGIKTQSQMSNGTASGDAKHNAVQGITLLDNTGNGTSLNPITKLTSADPSGATHSANISLTPAVARIELAPDALKIGTPASGGNQLVKAFNLTGFYLNNFYLNRQANLLSKDLFGQTMEWATTVKSQYSATEAVMYHYDIFSTPVPITIGGTSSNPGIAYHVFPGNTPHIIIAANNLDYGSGTPEDKELYWLISEMYLTDKTTQITSLEAGKVYKITSIEVGGTSYPRNEPYSDPIIIKVIVNVTPWNEVDVYVNPK